MAGSAIVEPVNHGRILRREQQRKLALDARRELVLVDHSTTLGRSDESVASKRQAVGGAAIPKLAKARRDL
jgi:hypothetical protein